MVSSGEILNRKPAVEENEDNQFLYFQNPLTRELVMFQINLGDFDSSRLKHKGRFGVWRSLTADDSPWEQIKAEDYSRLNSEGGYTQVGWREFVEKPREKSQKLE